MLSEVVVPAPWQNDDPPFIGPYAVRERIGHGGMGVVYLATGRDGRPVAVKTILASYARDARFRARFRDEVRAMRLVPPPFVARVLDSDPDADPPWLASEYVEGPTLQEAVESDGSWSYWEVKDLALATAMALRLIHRHVVHRDFKPANVLLSIKTVPKVIDFGLAAVADFSMPPGSRQGRGTLHYAAPEMLLGDEGKEAADIFAWGGTMVFASTREPPFGRGPEKELRRRILQDPPDLSGVDPRLREILGRALHKDPLVRPTAEGLLSDLGITTGNLEMEQQLVEETLTVGPGPRLPAFGDDTAPHDTVDDHAETTEVTRSSSEPKAGPPGWPPAGARWRRLFDRSGMPSSWYGLLGLVALGYLLLLPSWVTLTATGVAIIGIPLLLWRQPQVGAWLRHRRAGAPYHRALRLTQLGRLEEAEDLLWKLTLDGRQGWAARAAITLGNMLREQRRVRPAIRAYEEVPRLLEEQPTPAPVDRELAALAMLNLGHAYQDEQKGRPAEDSYRLVRSVAGEAPTRKAAQYVSRAVEAQQELMRRSDADAGPAARRRAPAAEAPPPLRYWPASLAVITAVIWGLLALGTLFQAGGGEGYLLRVASALAVLLLGCTAFVLALGARDDLRRLGPLVRASWQVPVALVTAAIGLVSWLLAIVRAALA